MLTRLTPIWQEPKPHGVPQDSIARSDHTVTWEWFLLWVIHD
jgi:hypothetical protein